MIRPSLVVATCFLLSVAFFSTVFGQPLTTSNAFVSAEVTDITGLITITEANHGPRLSFNEESFLTVAVNTNQGVQYYTNNNNLLLNPYPATPTLLLNGTNRIIRGKTWGTDTIRTTWRETNFDIVQDVYPVAFDNSGQIVFRFKIVNHSPQPITASCQYMLDIATSSFNPNYATDNPKFASRNGYIAGLTDYEGTDVPPFYVDFEYDLCTPQFPGTIGTGYLDDEMTPAPEKLMKPGALAIVDWPNTVQYYTWGWPRTLTSHDDNAVVLQWAPHDINGNTGADSIAEIGSSSWGTGEYCVCGGNLFAMIFHPNNVRYSQTRKMYTPATFPVEALVFNTISSGADSVKATQTVNGPMRILWPTDNRTPDSLSQLQNTFESHLPPCGMVDARWVDTVEDLINCSTDSVFNISLAIQGYGIVRPAFSNPDPCACPVRIDCTERDLVPPRFTKPVVNSSYRYDSTFLVYDTTLLDQGVRSITYTIDPPDHKLCDSVIIAPFQSCTKSPVSVSVKQNDSTCASCIYFTATDCAGNVSYDTVCFFAHVIPIYPDTLPPQFQLQDRQNWNDPTDTTNPCNARSSDWLVTDSRQYDRGLRSIEVVKAENMSVDWQQAFHVGAASTRIAVSVNDTLSDGKIILKATDTVGNVTYDTITYCTVGDSHAPHLSIGLYDQGIWPVSVRDTQAWDRGIDSVLLTSMLNCVPVQKTGDSLRQIDSTTWVVYPVPRNCPQRLDFSMATIDTFSAVRFCAQAWDCWSPSNASLQHCAGWPPAKDTLCPDTINITPPLSTNPRHIFITITDSHVVNGDTVSIDEGIDSIWFCGAYNVTLRYGGKDYPATADSSLRGIGGILSGKALPKYQKSITFELEVTDTTSQNPVAFACINAIDGAGNLLFCGQPFIWSYPINQDVYAPRIGVSPSSCLTLNVVATDTQMNDQGLYRIWLDTAHNINLAPADTTVSGAGTVSFPIARKSSDQSATGRLYLLDLYGSRSSIPAIRNQHITTTDIAVYDQDLSLKTGLILDTGKFVVPVYLDSTDVIPLGRKGLRGVQFSFHLTGSNKIDFIGTDTKGTATATWSMTGQPNGSTPNDYMVTGFGPSLPNSALSSTVPFVNLIFRAQPTAEVAVTEVVIDTMQCGEAVLYNGGNDTTLTGQNYSVSLPAPSGQVRGGKIILKGNCSPVIGDGSLPTIVSLSPVTPNPATSSTQIIYTVPAEASVQLELYNALGDKVRTLVSEIQKQGRYTLQLNTTGLAEGTYFLRLSSQGNVVSREVVLTH